MKNFVVLLVIFSAFFLSAEPVQVEFGSLPEKKLELIKKIQYGTGNDQVGIFIPAMPEEKPFGVNAVSGDGKQLFILDNMNKRALSLNLRTKVLKKEFSLPSETFDSLFFKNGSIYLNNNKESRLYVLADKAVKPATLPKIEKVTEYPYTKFLKSSAVRVFVGEKEFFELNFTDIELYSFMLVGKSDNGNIYFQVELDDGSRHILITSQTGNIIGKFAVPKSELYKPEKDIFVSGEGRVFIISPQTDSLNVYGGEL
ncbi:MAG: hypothetical protein ACOX2F_05450 [bacterium]